jgi:hypoxanthine-DNA glycosylase
MIETHPYEAFVQDNSTILILGSFPGIDQTRKRNDFEEWYYSAKRNKFWAILENVYATTLSSVSDKKNLLSEKGIAITDIILKAKRSKEGNLDQYLFDIEYNTDAIKSIIDSGKINRIYFTSQFVEKHFRKLFPDFTNCESLPSPSPRYARISLAEKITIYRQKLPK